MKVAITGGTGFVGRHLARSLAAGGHEVVLVARGVDQRDESARQLAGASFFPAGTDDQAGLVSAFTGCAAVAHCAAQVRVLAEGVVEPLPPCDPLPDDLLPRTRFSEQQIRAGLPKARPFGLRDLRGFA